MTSQDLSKNEEKTTQEQQDIFAIPEDDLLVQDAPVGWYAIVSNKIIEERLPVRFIYREKPDESAPFPDSGWRVFSGYENEGYSDDPDNFSILSLTRLVNYQMELEGLFWEDIGSAFEMKPGESQFVAVTD